MKRISQSALVVTALLALTFSRASAVPSPAETPTAAAQQNSDDPDLGAVEREIVAFRAAPIRLPDALGIAGGTIGDAIVADVSFDGSPEQPLYRLRTIKGDRLEELLIDATTGKQHGKPQPVDIVPDDRDSLTLLQNASPSMADAIRVAERAAGGQAVSGGMAKQRTALNFIIVVLSGEDLKQVVLEAPMKSRADRK